jgi:hypothetical protein
MSGKRSAIVRASASSTGQQNSTSPSLSLLISPW